MYTNESTLKSRGFSYGNFLAENFFHPFLQNFACGEQELKKCKIMPKYGIIGKYDFCAVERFETMFYARSNTMSCGTTHFGSRMMREPCG